MAESTMLTRREFLELAIKAIPAGALGTGCGLAVQPVLDQTSHRPWPVPQTRWVMFMRWHDLLFLHWPIRPALIRPLIPIGLDLDTFDGWCWIGVVPFRMTGVRPRYVPLRFAFPEINVRTYVKTPGRSGVWFFSLDAASWLAVRAARWYGLPYYDAEMTFELDQDAVHYRSVRVDKKRRPRRVQRVVSTDGSGLSRRSGYARSLAHRKILPLCRAKSRPDCLRRNPSCAMAAPTGRGATAREHDDAADRNRAA